MLDLKNMRIMIWNIILCFVLAFVVIYLSMDSYIQFPFSVTPRALIVSKRIVIEPPFSLTPTPAKHKDKVISPDTYLEYAYLTDKIRIMDGIASESAVKNMENTIIGFKQENWTDAQAACYYKTKFLVEDCDYYQSLLNL
jgi:hypothetical protein